MGTKQAKGKKEFLPSHRTVCKGSLLYHLSAVCACFILFVFLLLFWISLSLLFARGANTVSSPHPPTSYIFKYLLGIRIPPWGGTGFLGERKGFFQFYWEFPGIHHCISLRCTTWWLDLHILGNYDHNRFSSRPSSHTDKIKRKRKRIKEKNFSLKWEHLGFTLLIVFLCITWQR